MIKSNILITGYPGVGKTTLINNVLERLLKVRQGIRLAGFITREIREEGGRRLGFSICEIGREDATVMAHIDNNSPYRVGFYGVDVQALESIALPALAGGREADLIVVDEIGTMELFSEGFKEEIIHIVNSDIPLLASIKLKPNAFLDGIKSSPNSVVFRLERDNREEVEDSVYGLLCLKL
jgi:nucleoside-triphosphatase